VLFLEMVFFFCKHFFGRKQFNIENYYLEGSVVLSIGISSLFCRSTQCM
jgi:hypothetical protein